MVLQQLLFPNWERRIYIWCQYISTGIELLKSIQMAASSWRRISKSSWLYIFTSIWIFQLLWNICDCFFHRAAWVIIWALLVKRVYNRMYGWFPPHFTLVINCLKLQFDQSRFNYIISYPTTNPTHPPWLITKPSWFICSTSCRSVSVECMQDRSHRGQNPRPARHRPVHCIRHHTVSPNIECTWESMTTNHSKPVHPKMNLLPGKLYLTTFSSLFFCESQSSGRTGSYVSPWEWICFKQR
jgi:hypothetical protein